MSTNSDVSHEAHHHLRLMGGRDPDDQFRVATPLELLFDLTFVTSFSFAAFQYSHALAEGHLASALIGFALASFAICWAWINFSWFASAYDTDDWIFRLVTMVQMAGVLIFAIGIPRMFASLEMGLRMDLSMMVSGYVIMRLALVAQWMRAAFQDSARRRACFTYAVAIAIAQIGWVALAASKPSMMIGLTAFVALVLVELAGPVIAEQRDGGTPWHPHHIVERYGLFATIALGESVVGSIAAISAEVDESGWSMGTAVLCVAGIGLTFGMWWVYHIMPSARVLGLRRERAFVWGYGQMVIVSAIVAVGAGLHVVASHIEDRSQLGPLATLLAIAVPICIYLSGIYALYTYIVGRFDVFHVWLLAGTGAVVALSVIALLAGASMVTSLVFLALAPAVTILGFEIAGHRHQREALSVGFRN
jgi:low temperature requirement protein LtrA